MQSNLFNELIKSAGEALAHANGGKIIFTVTGSRGIEDEKFIYQCLDNFVTAFGILPEYGCLNSGNARGVDRIAEKWARERGYMVSIFKPDWSKGKGAGLERNKEMIDSSLLYIAIWDGKSRGTKHCFEYAKKKGLEGRIYIYE